MSPRAAWRLADLGVSDVYDYAGGKLDWLAHGLPYEGEADLVGRHLEDGLTCTVNESVADVAARVGAGADDGAVCVVVTTDRVVVGALSERVLREHGDARVGEVTGYGVTTVRPSEERKALEERMRAKHVTQVVVTDPGGHLLGLYRASPS